MCRLALPAHMVMAPGKVLLACAKRWGGSDGRGGGMQVRSGITRWRAATADAIAEAVALLHLIAELLKPVVPS